MGKIRYDFLMKFDMTYRSVLHMQQKGPFFSRRSNMESFVASSYFELLPTTYQACLDFGQSLQHKFYDDSVSNAKTINPSAILKLEKKIEYVTRISTRFLTRKRVTGIDITRYIGTYRAGKDFFFSLFTTSVTGQNRNLWGI